MMERSQPRPRRGVVVGTKMDKTAIVMVERNVKHPKYKKYIKRRKRFKAHDEQNECMVGDIVLIYETRPLSKDKNWRISKILKRAPQLLERNGAGE